MTISARLPRHRHRLEVARDWPLLAAAVSALLSFVMLFPPWLSSGDDSQNAFGDALQAAGPALIIVMAVATIASLAVAVTTADRRFVRLALVPSSVLLALYVVKVADVSELADAYNRLAASFANEKVGTGVGLWLGFVFALVTEMFVIYTLVSRWGTGEALAYPGFRPRKHPPHQTPPDTDPPRYPPPPDHPPDLPREGPDR
ncbi:hypothetical protein [Streptomyces griseosporeus]|uniref:hypothetical protein n=1 Tax=Streptomyces griseosporeus TaxID=1910 RepID=UPI003702398D